MAWVRRLLPLSVFLFGFLPASRGAAALLADAVSVSGDSISRAFDANTSLCNYGDNVNRVWATGDTHGSGFCTAGSEGTFSHAERLECAAGRNITIFNDAASGADIDGDFFNQASSIRTNLSASPAPRYAVLFLGHNDACTNTTSKTGNGCGGDEDPNNYCRTTNAAFEREFRRGMDQLIQIPSVRILSLALARISQLCNFGSKATCGLGFGLPCSAIWGSGQFNTCKSLTIDCSDTRRLDMYNTLLAYNEILQRVTLEYAAIPTGGMSASGAVKAADVAIRFSNAPFYGKFSSGDVSCCDCFHPDDVGQQKLADLTWFGLPCSSVNQCCGASTDPLASARCDVVDTTSFYPSGFWPGNPCGNGIIDPGEQCDDSNTSDGDCCSSTCQLDAAGAACASDGNGCTDDVCNGGGSCTHPNNSAPCNDGNACTQTDTCQDGSCTGTNPVVCAALDQCHVAGTCDSGTGACSNPAKPDGASCNDANACTQTDTCQSGVCNGTNPVVCGALDQCHVAGICDPGSGACTNPVKPNGTACSDGNACTQTDTCQSGACSGTNPILCTALDQCHGAGTCDTTTGVCTNPTRSDGTPCNDGSACTQTDTCQGGVCSGANPVTCVASDQCHDGGTCNPATGACSNPARSDGTPCNDGNACTQTDTCQSGTCSGANPVICTPLDQCHAAGSCDFASGLCSNPPRPNGSSCNDGNACTQTDSCQSGQCIGANPVVCAALDQCHVAGTCDPASGQCANPSKADGSSCNDANACTQTDTCLSGTCTGGNPVACSALDQCHVAGTCDPASGLCSDPNQPDDTPCDDGNSCTLADRCAGGTCSGNAQTCGDGIVQAQCGEVCDDGGGNGSDLCCSITCQLVDGDGDGVCDRDDPCTSPAPASKPRIVLRRLLTPVGDDTLRFSGQAVLPVPFAPPLDPRAHGVRVRVTGRTGTLLDIVLPAGPYTNPPGVGWKVNTRGTVWRYVNHTATPPGGIIRAVVTNRSARTPGLVSFAVQGKAGSYPVAANALPLDGMFILEPPAATIGQCTEATFPGPKPTPRCAFSTSGGILTCK